MSALTIRVLADTLLNLKSADLSVFEKAMLERMRRILLQAAEAVSDELDRRTGL